MVLQAEVKDWRGPPSMTCQALWESTMPPPLPWSTFHDYTLTGFCLRCCSAIILSQPWLW